MIDSFGTRHARSCQIAARERPRAGSKHMATFQAVAQTQSGCLIAARERPRAGSKLKIFLETIDFFSRNILDQEN